MLTRRDLIIKWSSYAVASLLLTFFHMLFLRDVDVLGVRTFLPPLIVAVVASVEDTRAGAIFALSAGLLCDVTIAGTFPCVYTLAFTLAAMACSLLARSVLQPGPICSVAVTALTFLVLDALNMAALYLKSRAHFGDMASLALRELVASCLLLLVCHPVMMLLHRKFTI